MVRRPTITFPLPEGLGIAVTIDFFGPLPVTPRGNTYILLFTYRFSRRADMYAVTAAEFTAESAANNIINRYISLLGMPAEHPLGQWSPVLLLSFARRLSASRGSENCPQLVPSKQQQWDGTGKSRDDPDAGNGRQRAPT